MFKNRPRQQLYQTMLRALSEMSPLRRHQTNSGRPCQAKRCPRPLNLFTPILPAFPNESPLAQESATSMSVASYQFSTTEQAPSPVTAAPTQHALRTEAPGLAWHGQPQRLQSPVEQTHARPNAHVWGPSRSQQASFGASYGAHWSSGSPVSAHSPVFPVTGASRQYPSGFPVVQASMAISTIHRGRAVQPLQPFVTQPIPTKPISTGLLFPGRDDRIATNEYPGDPQSNHCIMQSLHHAHIRSPKRLPIRPEALNERYYQSVRRLALGPNSIAPGAAVQKFSFHLGPKDRDRLTHVETDPDDLLPLQRYTNRTLRVRIRCCYLLDHQQHSITDGDWVTKDVVWPEHIFLEVNHSVLLKGKGNRERIVQELLRKNRALEDELFRCKETMRQALRPPSPAQGTSFPP
ncbi:uncharacterized protein B0I36DRAFT_43037 [Microdochium trichocladiopsis]|uniref:Uncharacterized protein n=1 Tax=Microdochium trichocladiopsis TaxID=1682393 RepID=A0A9P8XT74_9PEZI|nr:uncharacterized protein B0I36DRAFT_43037 [Microdochium trichocladiopsis]KAH7016129.1 hypothetical protein B0I36DRAFT_43037 [Microdochium trichocladiopsis]